MRTTYQVWGSWLHLKARFGEIDENAGRDFLSTVSLKLVVRVLRAAVAEKFLVFYALGGCSLAPQSKAGGFERLSHVGNDFALGKARDFANFFKSDPVGPGCPDDPIRTVF